MTRATSVTKRFPPDRATASDIDFGDFDALLGYHLRRAHGAMLRGFSGAVAEFDLTQKQSAILWLIQLNPGVSQVAVASALGMDRPTMMALTDRLELRGLLTRVRSTVDRRCQELHLTLSGRSLLAKLKKRVARHEQRIRALFTPAEYEILVSALRKLQEHA